MVQIISMTSLGVEPGGCASCGRDWKRGDRMTAIPYKDGSPAGWFCDGCRDCWEHGKPFPEGPEAGGKG